MPQVSSFEIDVSDLTRKCDIGVDAKSKQVVMIYANAKGRVVVSVMKHAAPVVWQQFVEIVETGIARKPAHISSSSAPTSTHRVTTGQRIDEPRPVS